MSHIKTLVSTFSTNSVLFYNVMSYPRSGNGYVPLRDYGVTRLLEALLDISKGYFNTGHGLIMHPRQIYKGLIPAASLSGARTFSRRSNFKISG